jgi:hypothetical protein
MGRRRLILETSNNVSYFRLPEGCVSRPLIDKGGRCEAEGIIKLNTLQIGEHDTRDKRGMSYTISPLITRTCNDVRGVYR